MGRRLEYQTVQELQEWIDMYFDQCKKNRDKQILLKLGKDESDGVDIAKIFKDAEDLLTDDNHPTITGLALFLGLTRQGLINYEGREEYFDTVREGKDRVEAYVEQRLYGSNVQGCIFSLKNNFNWKDKSEVEQSGGFNLTIGSKDADNA